ncbi:hypothetical protein Efla_005013 [Eimeria flavescens]
MQPAQPLNIAGHRLEGSECALAATPPGRRCGKCCVTSKRARDEDEEREQNDAPGASLSNRGGPLLRMSRPLSLPLESVSFLAALMYAQQQAGRGAPGPPTHHAQVALPAATLLYLVMPAFFLLQRLLPLLAAGLLAAAVAAPLLVSPLAGCGPPCPGFLGVTTPTAASALSRRRCGPLPVSRGGPPLRAAETPLPGKRARKKEVPGLTFIDWGRSAPPPLSAEAFMQQLQQQQQHQGSSKGVFGVLYCTTWDPRSKALVSALGLLHRESQRGEGKPDGGPSAPSANEQGFSRLPVYPLAGVRVTNSLVIARGRRALLKQRRMACNLKQLRHNERALSFMLNQQPPLQLHKLPALQLYTQHQQQQLEPQQQQQQQQQLEPQQQQQHQQQECCFPAQLVEIRAVSPRALQRLGADEAALLRAWGPEGPPEGPSQAGALGRWLSRLGFLYEEELRRVVEERLRQAEEEFPIYKEYNP